MAKVQAERAEAGVASISARLDGFIISMEQKLQSIVNDIRRAEDTRRAEQKDWKEDQKEWRSDLGKRLDKQDKNADKQEKWQWTVAAGVFAIFLSIIGFFISHLPIFKGM